MCEWVCEELNFTYDSLKSSLLALSTFQCVHMAYERPLCSHEIADKFIENDCESRALCGCIFPAPASHLLPLCSPPSVSLSLPFWLFLLLSLARSVCSCSACLHVSFMQYAGIFAQKYWWFGKCALKRQNPLSCSSHQDGRLTARQAAWCLAPGCSYLLAFTCYQLPST